MSEVPVSHKFLYDLGELYTKRKTKEITEEEFSIQRDILIAQEAKSQETMGPLLITKQLEAMEADVASTVSKKFQEEEQEESARAARERFAKIAERNRIQREEKAKQDAIEAENKKRLADQNRFRSAIDAYIYDLEDKANRWQILFNWLQIIAILLTTATAVLVNNDSFPRGYVAMVGYAAAALGAILSFLKLQDKIYSSRKALADLRLECQMYDHCIDEYKNRHDDAEGAYLTFSKKVTIIQATQMLQEVELLNPKKRETVSETSETKENQKKEETSEEEPQETINED